MKLLVSLSLLVLLLLFPLFHQGIYLSHDGDNHIARFASYYQAFQDGHFPARWAESLNFGYGTPVLMFFYPLPGYFASIVHFLGFSFASSFKIIMGVSFAAAFVTFYLWAKLVFRKDVAILGCLLYGLVPYHFLNLYVRGDVGEMLAFVFIPLVLWAIKKTLKTKKIVYCMAGGLFYGLLILSHNGVSLMFSPVFVLYGLLHGSNKKDLLRLVFLFCLGLMVSAFFWIPALYEGRYVNAHLFIGQMYKDHFPTLWQLITPAWGFGAEIGKFGGLSPQLGLLNIFFVIVSLVLWVKSKKDRKSISLWIVVFFAAVFIMMPLSNTLWSIIPILRLYEFPWRFVGLASFGAVVLACFVLEKIKNMAALIVIGIVLIVISFPFIRVNGYVTRSDEYYKSFTGTTYYHGEASPIWTAGDPGMFAKQQIEIIGGNGKVTNVQKKTQIHTFTVDARNSVTILDNTLYFPGWIVEVDKNSVPIQFQDPNHRGLITFQTGEGRHHVRVMFRESKIRFVSDSVSLVTLLIVIVFFGRALLYNRRVKHS